MRCPICNKKINIVTCVECNKCKMITCYRHRFQKEHKCEFYTTEKVDLIKIGNRKIEII